MGSRVKVTVVSVFEYNTELVITPPVSLALHTINTFSRSLKHVGFHR